MKIYTKTGDKGKTSLISGARIWKDDLRLEAIGSIDELISVLGIIVSKIKKIDLQEAVFLLDQQKELIMISSILANQKRTSNQKSIQNKIKEIEKKIDQKAKELSQLQKFILPNGEVSSLIHLARAICRRAERRIVYIFKKEKTESSILVYLNRFSDFLFVLARWISFKLKEKEIIWEK